MYKVLDHKNSKGQGLMEYALILVLVTLAVIVILALLGPTIGRTYSNVVTGLNMGAPTALPIVQTTPDPAWVFCANEGGTCSFSGTKHVRFGKNGTYIEKTFTDGASCAVSAFGSDPVYGVTKECLYMP